MAGVGLSEAKQTPGFHSFLAPSPATHTQRFRWKVIWEIQLRECFLNHFSAEDCWDFVSVIVIPRQLVLIDSHGVQQSGMHIGRSQWTFCGNEAQFICRADDLTAFDPAASQPHGVACWRVVSSATPPCSRPFNCWGTAKFSAPHDERGFEQTSLFQVS